MDLREKHRKNKEVPARRKTRNSPPPKKKEGQGRDKLYKIFRVALVRFGSVTVRARDGSSGSGFRFRRFLSGKGFRERVNRKEKKQGIPLLQKKKEGQGRDKLYKIFRVALVQFGSVTVRARDGSSGSGFRFRRFLSGKGFRERVNREVQTVN